MASFRTLKGILLAPESSRYHEAIQRDLPEVEWTSLTSAHGNEDLALLLIEADRGISAQEVEEFQRVRELQIPTLLLVASLIPEPGEDRWDFDDIVMLANRILEDVIAPYLVLHDDQGVPSGLYDLSRDVVIDRSGVEVVERPADAALKELTADFKSEWIEQDFQDDDFISGLRVVAIPYLPERHVGITEARMMITKLAKVQP